MRTTNETGHAKNVANFGELITSVRALGDVYKPVRKELAIAELENRLLKADEAIASVNNALAAYRNAVALREDAFRPLSILCTRVLNAVRALGGSESITSNVRAFVRRIQGVRLTPKPAQDENRSGEVNGAPAREVSTSQMGYDRRINNLDSLIELLATIPTYAPNEQELSLQGLRSFENELRQKHQAVTEALVTLDNARKNRNALLYDAPGNMVDLSLNLKNYVKSAFSAGSPEFRQLKGIHVKRLS